MLHEERGAPQFNLGDVVLVSARLKPGTNKPGGVGRVIAVHDQPLCYDVKYILGGNEKQLPEGLLSLQDDMAGRRSKRPCCSESPSEESKLCRVSTSIAIPAPPASPTSRASPRRLRCEVIAARNLLKTPQEIEAATNELLRKWGVQRHFTGYDSFDSLSSLLRANKVPLKFEDVAHTGCCKAYALVLLLEPCFASLGAPGAPLPSRADLDIFVRRLRAPLGPALDVDTFRDLRSPANV